MPAGTVDVFARPGYYCKKVSDEAARYIEREKPELLFVHFSDPDEAGHADGWMTASYRKAALAADACLGTIYRALQQANILDDTLVIVSADHGGHARGHSGALPSDREIPWIASGPASVVAITFARLSRSRRWTPPPLPSPPLACRR